jgi:hypothetical protein
MALTIGRLWIPALPENEKSKVALWRKTLKQGNREFLFGVIP